MISTSRRELSSSFFSPLQGKAPKEIHAILTITLACFLPGLATGLSAPLYLLTAIGLTPGGSSTVHIYTQTVQYTFTHKQYTEQHNGTEYTERDIYNNKNT